MLLLRSWDRWASVSAKTLAGGTAYGSGRTNGHSRQKPTPPSYQPQQQQEPKQNAMAAPPQTQYSSHSQQQQQQSHPRPQTVTQHTTPSPILKPPLIIHDSILGKPFEDVRSLYTLGKELGRGQFGVTYLCTEKATGLQYACKSISKRKLSNKGDREDIKREIEIMQHLTGQPNIVEFKGAYEDRDSVHLVMELCSGGELFDRIIAKGQYSERAAATLCRAIVNVVNICHFMGVMHRDLKPENFLLATKDENAMLKATDFGLSVFIEEGKQLRDIVGSAYYVAPEVLRRSYGKEADIWSAGVILYILLSGVPPFWAESPGQWCNRRTSGCGPRGLRFDPQLRRVCRNFSSKWGMQSKDVGHLGWPPCALPDLPWWSVGNFRETGPATPRA